MVYKCVYIYIYNISTGTPPQHRNYHKHAAASRYGSYPLPLSDLVPVIFFSRFVLADGSGLIRITIPILIQLACFYLIWIAVPDLIGLAGIKLIELTILDLIWTTTFDWIRLTIFNSAWFDSLFLTWFDLRFSWVFDSVNFIIFE